MSDKLLQVASLVGLKTSLKMKPCSPASKTHLNLPAELMVGEHQVLTRKKKTNISDSNAHNNSVDVTEVQY